MKWNFNIKFTKPIFTYPMLDGLKPNKFHLI